MSGGWEEWKRCKCQGNRNARISSTNTSHDKLTNQIESSSKEHLTNRNNIAVGNGIKILVHQPDYYKTACRVASKPRGMGSRRIRLKKKSHGQSMSKRELCGDAEGHGFKAAITVRRENGAATTRVNGRLRSTELEEVEKKVVEFVKRLAKLQLADKTQEKASYNVEGKQRQRPSMITVQAEERHVREFLDDIFIY